MYDNIDIEQILRTQRLLKRYVDCLKGIPNTCTKEGLKLKELLPDALLHNCKECSDNQKKGITRVSIYLMNCHPKWWSDLEKIHDPQGSYKASYQDTLKAQGASTPKETKCYH
ncbi:unnamed protein product [Phaedon cochleariae]|uniref:Chemosensory protein n=1 Tax=Phaedon cochleariae TaxID=80249 RepID=A0A9P0DG46_PHACE|nr:unnamed protein product [Phaedon cochleariae]